MTEQTKIAMELADISAQLAALVARVQKLDGARETRPAGNGNGKLIGARQVAEKLGLPLARVYELARTGALPAIHLGERQIRFSEAALEAWLAQQEAHHA